MRNPSYCILHKQHQSNKHKQTYNSTRSKNVNTKSQLPIPTASAISTAARAPRPRPGSAASARPAAAARCSEAAERYSAASWGVLSKVDKLGIWGNLFHPFSHFLQFPKLKPGRRKSFKANMSPCDIALELLQLDALILRHPLAARVVELPKPLPAATEPRTLDLDDLGDLMR